MPDEKKIETNQDQVLANEFGTIRVDDEVVQAVAAIALGEVEGVVRPQMQGTESFIGNVTDNVVGMLGKKNAIKGVRVDYKDSKFNILLTVKVRYGFSIPDEAHDIQRSVKKAVETMTGMKVRMVDVFVQSIVFEQNSESATGV